MKTVLFLFSCKEILEYSRDFQEFCNKTNTIKIICALYEDVTVKIINNEVAIDCLGKDISSYDLVYFKDKKRYKFLVYSIAHYLKGKNTAFIDEELSDPVSYSKLNDFMKLASGHIPQIDTVFASNQKLFELAKKKELFKFPFIVKDINSSKGKNNYLINNLEELKKVFKTETGMNFVAQPFIENDCDYRILTFGYTAKIVIKRARIDDTKHLNNTSQGAKTEIIPVEQMSPAYIKIAQDAARTLRREIAGVDLLIEKNTSRAYILEVNMCPQLFTGAFIDRKRVVLLEYLTKKAGK